jgi:hypothetical protein
MKTQSNRIFHNPEIKRVNDCIVIIRRNGREPFIAVVQGIYKNKEGSYMYRLYLPAFQSKMDLMVLGNHLWEVV